MKGMKQYLLAGIAVSLMLLVPAVLSDECSDGASVNVNIVMDNDGQIITMTGAGSNLGTIVKDAVTGKGHTIDCTQVAIKSVDGRTAPDGMAWTIQKWSPPNGWQVINLNATPEKGSTYCIHLSSVKESGGTKTYSNPSYTPISKAYFYIIFQNDYDANEYVNSVLTIDDRIGGFWISGEGGDLADAFKNVCDAYGLQLDMSDGGSDPDYKGWLNEFLGLRDVSLPNGDYVYWSQYYYCDGNWIYSQTMGHYDPGVYPYFALVRGTGADGEMMVDALTDADVNHIVDRTSDLGTVHVSSITINGPNSGTVGDEISLSAVITPSNAQNKSVNWTSARPDVATVDHNGKVKCVSEGTARIKATSAYSSSIYDEIDITVSKADEQPTVIPVSAITLDESSITIQKGETSKLSATVSPSNATDKGVTWSSSDISVATVEDGTVTAKSVGSAVITARSADGKVSSSCSVTVQTNEGATIKVTGITLNRNSVSLGEGSSTRLTATVAPSNATDKNVSWTSSNTGVATVSDGSVTAVSAGTSVITARTSDGGFEAKCTITVTQNAIKVTGITLNRNSVSLEEGSSTRLTATVAPSNATDKNIMWSSSDNRVATVSDGSVTAVSAGTAVITAITSDGGFEAKCTITVTQKVIRTTGVSMNKSSLEMEVGSSSTLTAFIEPSNATDKKVSWTSSNTGVATVANGKVTAVSAGTTEITVSTSDGGYKATCSVTVNPVSEPGEERISVKDVSLDKNSITMMEGDETYLHVTISPSTATDKTVRWKTSNPSVVAVYDGKIVAVGTGTASITVTTNDRSRSDSCLIKVEAEKSDESDVDDAITMKKSSLEMEIGDTATLFVEVKEGYTSHTIAWTSSDTGVATVHDGTVKSVGPGITTVKASLNGTKSYAWCVITVKEPVSYTQEIGSDLIEEAIKSGSGLDIDLPNGRIAVPSDVLRIHTSGFNISMDPVSRCDIPSEARKKIGDCPAYVLKFNEGAVTKFSANMEVSFEYTMPEDGKGRSVSVYHVTDDGIVQKMNTRYSDGYVSFETDHFSIFFISAETEEQPASDGTVLIIGGAAAAIALIAIATIVIKRKSAQ